MSKHKTHPHGKDHHRHGHHNAEHDHATKKKMIHHDWRFWVAIVLMALGIGAYILSMDESLRPGGVEEPEVPAAAE